MESIDKQRAVEIARGVAREAYGDLEGYEVSVDEADREWQIRFQFPGTLERGGRSHFAVWVAKVGGKARLFRGR